MTLQDLQELLDYHYWARDRVLDAAAALAPEQYTRELGGSFGSIRQTLVHTYAAEWAWHSRFTGHSPAALLPVERFPDVPALRDAWVALEAQMRAFVAALDERDVERSVDYTLLSGLAGRSTFRQMLQHVVNHATYHRGQVTTLLRQVGASPPKSTDLIVYYREQQTPA